MGHVHHPDIKERGIAPLQLPSYQRPSGLAPSSLVAAPFRGNGSQSPLERGPQAFTQKICDKSVALTQSAMGLVCQTLERFGLVGAGALGRDERGCLSGLGRASPGLSEMQHEKSHMIANRASW